MTKKKRGIYALFQISSLPEARLFTLLASNESMKNA